MSYLTSWEELRQDGQLPKFSTKEEQIQKKLFAAAVSERQARGQASRKVKCQTPEGLGLDRADQSSG